MKLLIAIPALNEEEAIASTIERCLEARSKIINETPVTEVEITVVSDGSTDGTVEIAGRYTDEIRLIVFEKNRGYGAAITEAWLSSDAALLSFLDADGTCDPNFFVTLCREVTEQWCDVAIGCRLNEQSQMPLIRRFGNTLFAWTLSLLSSTRVKDTASGMRVVRRSSLTKLFPLPAGLHFTPAMSARAILSPDLTIREVNMPYHEREGESKLNPIKDGIRFLRVILKTALLYRPSRLLGLGATALVGLTCLMMAYPVLFYLQHGRIEEWMIYRSLVGELLMGVAITIGSVSYLGSKASNISLADEPANCRDEGPWGWLLSRNWFWAVPCGLVLSGGLFVSEASQTYLASGTVTEHWSHFVAMMFCLSAAANLSVVKVVDYCLNMLAKRLSYLKQAATPDEATIPFERQELFLREAA